jgi:hypothetical protein
MAKFNETKKEDVRNLAGGKAYKESNEMQLASLLLTSFGDDKYYQKENEVYQQLERLISVCDKQFVGKAIIYARKQFGMRTITHIASSMLANYTGGNDWGKRFYDKVVNRVDDMTEIVACHLSRKQKLTNAMKKGFASALGRFDYYQLAKYKGEGKAVKLVDIVNMCHPIQTAKNNGAIEKLIKGELKSFDTWESELSSVGNDVEAKKAVWNKLLDEQKLGYFALLRNLRNIIQLNDETLKNKALNALLNESAIKKSLVLPFRFSTAYDEMAKIDTDAMRAVSRACEIACSNVPKLEGKTLIALDVSGSMSSFRVSDIASLFTAVLLKSNDCDLITFADDSHYRRVNPDDSVMTIKNAIKYACGGTNFESVFRVANKKYDRVILLSDMQAWAQESWFSRSPNAAYERYKREFDAPNCKFYSIDLAGYGTLQMPQQDVYCLAGFSEKIFDLMKHFECDKNALITAINSVEL